MGDDGLGVYCIDYLESNLKSKEIEYISTFQLTLELVEKFKEFERIIFIDASYSEFEFKISTPLYIDTTSASISHNLNPKRLIEIANQLYAKEFEYVIFSISATEFHMQEYLSKQMREPFKILREYLFNYLKSLIKQK